MREGVPNHLFLGHGPNQEDFERRDFGTTNEMFYDRKLKTEVMINPHTTVCKLDLFLWGLAHTKPLDKMHTNARIEDQGKLFGKTGTAAGETKPRSYNEFTQSFDKNFNKIGLRKWERSVSSNPDMIYEHVADNC